MITVERHLHGRLIVRVTRKVVVNMDICLVLVSRRVSQPANGRLQVLHLSINSSLLLDKKDQDLPISMVLTKKETGPRNPKITALVSGISNDNSPTQDQSEPTENQLTATDVFQSPAQMPRAKGDIIGYSDDEVSRTKVKYLPATVDGLLKRFNKLYKECTQGRHEHRNELVALLDELLRQNG